MTRTEMNMHRINLEAVAAYLSNKQEEPDDAPSQHRMAVNRALKDLDKTNSELEKIRAYNAILISVLKEYQMIYGEPGTIVGELVRCKDCKYYTANVFKNNGFNYGECHKLAIGLEVYTAEDWFCADGERKVTV